MENDIVKMLFFQRQRQKKRRKIKTISGSPPLSFKAKAGTLKDYRIYGNTAGGEAVGDLEATGEHAGEYKVPVTVEGKNLLKNIATSQIINGITFTVNDDKSITVFGELTNTNATFVIANSSDIPGRFDHSSAIIPKDLTIISTTTNNSIPLRAQYTDDTYKGVITNDTPFIVPKDIGMVYIQVAESLPEPVTIYPMIRKAYIEDDTYEPYHAPITTPTYLPEQIRKVGDEAEYIDYGQQKQHFADGTETDVTLPALPTLAGTNVLTVGTAVQPSDVYIKGRIKKGE